ncbi:MAG: pseudouridine synthase [Actinomycetota bacterium]
MMSRTRISKYLAECGLGSRRKCEKLVQQGKVEVNGAAIKDLSYKVLPEDTVICLGKKIEPQPKIVIALNKPPGYLSTVKDKFGRRKVTDLVEKDIRLFPVGRLDYNSRGLLILTNDGELAYRLTHPKFMIPKTYKVKVAGWLKDKDIDRLRRGVEIEEIKAAIASVKITGRTSSFSNITMQLLEGRKRIIRRVLKKLGYEVIDLQRVKIGNFELKGLKEGQYKVLNKKQIGDLNSSLA